VYADRSQFSVLYTSRAVVRDGLNAKGSSYRRSLSYLLIVVCLWVRAVCDTLCIVALRAVDCLESYTLMFLGGYFYSLLQTILL